MELPDLETVFVYAEPAASEERLRELEGLPEVRVNLPYYCELLTRLARCQGLQRRFDEAHQTLDRAEALSCEDPNCRVRIPLERGRVFNSAGEKPQAVEQFQSAFKLAGQMGLDALQVDAAHMLGIATEGEASLEWNEKAIALAERSNDAAAKKWFGPLYNNTAWTYHAAGNYERALELFERALAWRTEKGQTDEILIARWCVGRCLRSLGRFEEAFAIQQSLQSEHARAGTGDGYVDEELGELCLARGDQAAAAPHFGAAYEKLSKDPWLEANERARLDRILELSRS